MKIQYELITDIYTDTGCFGLMVLSGGGCVTCSELGSIDGYFGAEVGQGLTEGAAHLFSGVLDLVGGILEFVRDPFYVYVVAFGREYPTPGDCEMETALAVVKDFSIKDDGKESCFLCILDYKASDLLLHEDSHLRAFCPYRARGISKLMNRVGWV